MDRAKLEEARKIEGKIQAIEQTLDDIKNNRTSFKHSWHYSALIAVVPDFLDRAAAKIKELEDELERL